MGKRNSASPVTLFKIVCGNVSFPVRTNLQTAPTSFITAIMQTHIQSHTEISRYGANLIKATAINTKSDTVSSLSPKSLTLPIFLATVPSVYHIAEPAKQIERIKPRRRQRYQQERQTKYNARARDDVGNIFLHKFGNYFIHSIPSRMFRTGFSYSFWLHRCRRCQCLGLRPLTPIY